MSVAGILASSLFSNPLSQLAQQSPAANKAGSATQSKSTSGAQSMFSELQQKIAAQGANATDSTSLSGQINQLGNDLQSGNLSAAQSDFTTLKATLAQSATSHLNQLMTVPKAFLGGSTQAGSSSASGAGSSSDPLLAAFQAYSSLQQNPLNSNLSNSALTNANSLNINI